MRNGNKSVKFFSCIEDFSGNSFSCIEDFSTFRDSANRSSPKTGGQRGSSHPSKQIFSSDFEERSDDHYYIIHRQSIFSQIFGRDFSEDSDKPHER